MAAKMTKSSMLRRLRPSGGPRGLVSRPWGGEEGKGAAPQEARAIERSAGRGGGEATRLPGLSSGRLPPAGWAVLGAQMAKRRLLLVSNSTLHGGGYLEHCQAHIQDFLGP